MRTLLPHLQTAKRTGRRFAGIVHNCTATVLRKADNGWRLSASSELRQPGEGPFRTRNEVNMSRRSGDRSRFNRLRKAKMHDRTRIRALRTSLGLDEHPGQKREAPAIEDKIRGVSGPHVKARRT